MMPIAFRTVAILIAVLGVLDPPVETSRPRPVVVRFELAVSPGSDADQRAEAVRDRLARELRDLVVTSGARDPDAIVIVGDAPPESLPTERVPMSTVSLATASAPNVRIVRLTDPSPAALRQSIPIDAEFEAIGMSGAASVFTVSDRGAVVARTEHRWMTDRERHRARFVYAPAGPGLHVVRVAAQPLDAERSAGDNAADVALLVDGRPLRVLAFDPRPSWNATFVRRALEADPRFDVESIARSSRGATVRTRNAPPTLAGAALDELDAVIAGAPEDLRPEEVDALSRFARQRGGAVVFLPDRRPSGAYAGLLPAEAFEEVLVETPVRLAGITPAAVRASELLVARATRPSASAVAAVERSGRAATVSVGWTHGAGRMILWGALDAWRYRADDGDGFARFWQAAVADLAVGSPARVSVSATPRVAAVHERIVVRATLRPTEYGAANGRIELPPVRGSLVSADGRARAVRLWPTAEVGVFEGHAGASGAGTHDVVVIAGSQAGRTSVVVTDGPRRPFEPDAEAFRLIAESTGGVHVSEEDVRPLGRHLRELAGATGRTTSRPMRSPWWFLPFASTLSAEWALRRRRGLK